MTTDPTPDLDAIRRRHAVLAARDWDVKAHAHGASGCRCLSCDDDPTGWQVDHPSALDCEELVAQTPNDFGRKRGSCDTGPLLSWEEADALAHAAGDIGFLLAALAAPAAPVSVVSGQTLRDRCSDPIECEHEAALGEARETNRRLNLRAQRLESELAAYRRAVRQWEVSERGTYISHASLRTIGLASGKDILGSVRHLKHFERVEQAEAAIERARALHQPDANGECQHCHYSSPCPTVQALERADAVLAVLPADGHTTNRAAVLREAADDLAEFVALHGSTSRTVAGWRGAIGFLRRLAAEAHQPEPAPREWCKCPSCWGWFVEEHPGEDLDELGRDLGWWSGLPVHRDTPAGVRQQPDTEEWQERAKAAEAAVNRARAALNDCKARGATGMQYERAVAIALGDCKPVDHPGPLCHETDPVTLHECALRARHDGDHEDGDLRWPATAPQRRADATDEERQS